jgi:multidrug efflux pump subunit AcrB
MEWYLRLLRWSIAHRWKTMGLATLFFIGSLVLLAVVPKSFVPPTDFSSSQVNIELPPGVRLEETARVSARVAEILRERAEVTDVIESIGGADVRAGEIFVSLVQPSERDMSQDEWEKRIGPLLREIPDARVSFASFGPGGGKPVSIYIVGDDPALVDATAHEVIAEMRSLPELDDPRINGDYQRPEIVIRPRTDIAAELGVSVASIGQTIRIATIGDLPQNAPKFSLSDRQIPIRVSLLESSRQDLSTIENLPIPTARGGSVPLKAVAEIRFGHGPSVVRRYDQSRRAYLEAGIKPGFVLGDAMSKVNDLPSLRQLPDGVRRIDVGESEFFGELLKSFGIAMGAGILMVFAVMVLLFARVFQPITILSALPLSVGGAILALLMIGESFSLAVVIGFLMLMGIVGKNSILLVDFAIEEMRAGRDRVSALMESGHKRARPIVMTTVAMVAGMLPIAIGLGGDSSFNRPMAIAVIGGLVTSTALTLVVVPAVFTLIDDIERWVGPKFSKILNTEAGGATETTAGLKLPPRAAPEPLAVRE